MRIRLKPRYVWALTVVLIMVGMLSFSLSQNRLARADSTSSCAVQWTYKNSDNITAAVKVTGWKYDIGGTITTFGKINALGSQNPADSPPKYFAIEVTDSDVVVSKVNIGGVDRNHCVVTSNAGNYSGDNYNGLAIVRVEATAYGTYGQVRITITKASDGSTLYQIPSTEQPPTTTGGSYVTISSTITGSAPAITTQPSSATVTAGQTATFTVAASGTAPLSYQWQKNGSNVSGATSASYTTGALSTSDSGSKYKCTVTNAYGSATSNEATLTVNAPPPSDTAPSITTQPSNITVSAGQTATFTVAASGTAPLSYQWKKNGSNISGATSSSYTTGTLATGDSSSKYKCTVTNSVGNVTSNEATLTVNAVGGGDSTPTPTPSSGNNTGNTGTGNTGTSTTAAPQVVVANTPAPQVGVSAGTGAAPAAPVSSINVPSSLTAEDFPGDQGGNTTLKWKASTSSSINGYMVYRSTTNNTKDFVNVAKTEKTVLQYIDTKADVGTTFYYFVRAYKGTSESKSSNTVSFASVDNLAPGIPVNLVVTSYSKSIIKLSWTANIDTDLSEYILNINNASGTNIETVKLTKSTLSYNVVLANHPKLVLATDYQFTLQATDIHNNTSNPSTAVTASFKEAPVVVPTETKTQAQKLLTPTNLSIGGGATLILISIAGWLIRRRITRLP
ncbi:MAG: immunoglobulin domain-containing protein [Patescibacteria group bacterium]|jgi:hypothetical protein